MLGSARWAARTHPLLDARQKSYGCVKEVEVLGVLNPFTRVACPLLHKGVPVLKFNLDVLPCSSLPELGVFAYVVSTTEQALQPSNQCHSTSP
jgi:hypothetical protein